MEAKIAGGADMGKLAKELSRRTTGRSLAHGKGARPSRCKGARFGFVAGLDIRVLPCHYIRGYN
jgi:hypothetical protein